MTPKFPSLGCGLAAAVLLSSTLYAEEPAKPAPGQGRPMLTPEQRVAEMKEKLGITDEQATKIRAVFAASAEKVKALREDASLSQEDRRAKMMEIMKGTREEVAPILTPDQQAKWKEEMEKRRAAHGGAATPPAAK